MTQEIIQKIFDLTSPIVAEEGCELIDVEIAFDMGQRVLRLYIDKDEGIIVKDCSRVSHAIEDLLEVEQVLSGQYNLEVSSPGLNRPLRKIAHFQKVLGKVVDVRTKEKIDGRGHFKGILKSVGEDSVAIQIDNQDFSVPLEKVSKAKLVVTVNDAGRNAKPAHKSAKEKTL